MHRAEILDLGLTKLVHKCNYHSVQTLGNYRIYSGPYTRKIVDSRISRIVILEPKYCPKLETRI